MLYLTKVNKNLIIENIMCAGDAMPCYDEVPKGGDSWWTHPIPEPFFYGLCQYDTSHSGSKSGYLPNGPCHRIACLHRYHRKSAVPKVHF